MTDQEKIIYADNAATTPVSAAVFRAMEPYLTTYYGNPSSIYSVGRKAKRALEEARDEVARCLNAEPGEIYFTSGGSEADNWAIKGAAHQLAKRANDISSPHNSSTTLFCIPVPP